MNLYQLLIAISYTAIVASLIWARFRFFKITSNKSKLVSYFNDPAVLIQIVFTYGLLLSAPSPSFEATISAFFCYCAALILFWWAIRTAGALDFASSEGSGAVITSGAFALVRHPFYLSYIIVWLTNAVLFNSLYLWISCVVLIGVYIYSALEEEKGFAASAYSAEYLEYMDRVGMLVPRLLNRRPEK